MNERLLTLWWVGALTPLARRYGERVEWARASEVTFVRDPSGDGTSPIRIRRQFPWLARGFVSPRHFVCDSGVHEKGY